MKISMYKVISLLLMLAIMASSCEKWFWYKPDCETGNCVTVSFKGSVVVRPSGTAINGIPVDVNFSYSKKGTTSPSYTGKIASGKTDKNGEFNLIGTIDTISVDNYSFLVRIPVQEGYISPAGFHSPSVSKYFYSIDEGVEQNINFELLQKTKLTINLNKIQTDDIENLRIHLFYDIRMLSSGGFIYDLSAVELERIEMLQHETAADIYTKIRWENILKNGERLTYIDSLICKPNINNVFNITL